MDVASLNSRVQCMRTEKIDSTGFPNSLFLAGGSNNKAFPTNFLSRVSRCSTRELGERILFSVQNFNHSNMTKKFWHIFSIMQVNFSLRNISHYGNFACVNKT